MRRERCGGCASTRLDTILDLGKTPPANSLPATVDEAETFWPLQLGVCGDCLLVQQMEVVPDDVLYGEGYAFYSSASLPKVAYHRDLSDRLLAEHPQQARRLTVEIACNDGDLLRHFADIGCNVLGVDPALGPAGRAGQFLPVMVEPFSLDCAERIRDAHGPAGLIIANHVIGHVADLGDVFEGIGWLLGPDGILVVEVQYLADLIVGNQIDHVYHEHRSHFSLTSLSAVAARHGLHPHAVRHTPAQSGSISVTFGRQSRASMEVARVGRAERWLDDPSAYQSLQGRAEHIRTRLVDLLDEQHRAGRRVAGYAAPAKATTLLNWCGVGPDRLDYVVDTTPYKQGRHIPGVKVPIVGRQWDCTAQDLYTTTRPRDRNPPDVWCLLAHNYLGDVLRREWSFTGAGGQWIVPVPVPVLL